MVEMKKKAKFDSAPPPAPSEFSQKLLECCERAYLKGLSPIKIQQVLHSPHLFQQLQNKKTQKRVRRSPLITWISVLLWLTAVICGWLVRNDISKWIHSFKDRRCLLPSHPLVMEMVRPIANCAFCQNGRVVELKGPVESRVFKGMAYSSRPIIVREGAFNRSAQPPLTFQRLKDIFESEDKGVDTVSEECQFLPFRAPFSSLRDAFERIPKMVEWGEPWYIGWSNCHPGVASKLRAIVPRPSFLPEESGVSAIDWIFVGSPGLGAAMHIDYVRRPSWQAQLSGVKTWVIIPPPECEGVCPPSVKFTIYPGDLLFLETNTWYHETFIEGNQLSISVGSEYD